MVKVVEGRLTDMEVDMVIEEVSLKLTGMSRPGNLVAEVVINLVDQQSSFEQVGLVKPARKNFSFVQTWLRVLSRIFPDGLLG